MTSLKRSLLVCSFLAFALCGSQLSVGQPFKPSVKDSEKTKVLVLGTPHLITLRRTFSEDHLVKVLAVLERFHPDVIGVESIPPASLADMISRPAEYDETVKQFGGRRVQFGKKMQKRLGFSWFEAYTAAEKGLQELKKDTGAEKRSALILNLIAAYDDLTALIQWSYLPEAFRKDCKEIPADVRTYLERRLKGQNERISIGVTLARKLGHERLHYIDDHHDKDVYNRIVGDLITALEDKGADKGVEEHPFFKDVLERQHKAMEEKDLYPHYRYINSLEYGARDSEILWDIWFNTGIESGLDRTRLVLWEVRNLNMASHVRRATARIPGGRMLVIVGSAHKPFLETYLNQLAGLKLEQFNDLPEPER